MAKTPNPRVAIVSRDRPETWTDGRFKGVETALRRAGFEPQPCWYDETREADVAAELGACAAALVWVNPVQNGRYRDGLNALLRQAAAGGVLVSAHPDAIERMGTKAVLAATRAIGWSGDAWFYATPAALSDGLPVRLAAGPRVLKQNRGHSGIGVWRLDALGEGRVRVIAASDRTAAQEMTLAAFLAERTTEFDAVGGFVDQAFQARLSDGMIRCYMSGERLAGFGWQKVRALLEPDGEPTPPRTYSGPDDPRFQALRRRMEDDWTPALRRELRLADDDLPLLWDADFLFGPPSDAGEDTHVLCEINVSSVSPMPQQAPDAIAATLRRRLEAPV